MEAIHQIEESQQDMLPFIDIYEPSTGVRRKFSRGGKQILLPLFQGGGKKAEKLAKFDKLVNFKAIFGTISLKIQRGESACGAHGVKIKRSGQKETQNQAVIQKK
jgi:hypothetical protein